MTDASKDRAEMLGLANELSACPALPFHAIPKSSLKFIAGFAMTEAKRDTIVRALRLSAQAQQPSDGKIGTPVFGHSDGAFYGEAQPPTIPQPGDGAGDGEPVAWQYRFYVEGWLPWKELDCPIDVFRYQFKFNFDNGSCELRPLYTRP